MYMRQMKFILAVIITIITVNVCNSQIIPQNGVSASKPQMIAFKNATIIVSPDRNIENGTLLIQDDQIIDVGISLFIPNEAVIIDCEGKVILPSFIETWSSIGLSANNQGGNSASPQLISSKKGAYHWNESIKPETDAGQLFTPDEVASEQMLKLGFGLALVHVPDGIARGTAAVIGLGKGNANGILFRGKAAQIYSFEKGNSSQTYPSSQMGAIALLRQTFYDLKWYSKSIDKATDLSLEAMAASINLPFIFKTSDKWEILRASKIAREFGYEFNFLGSGNEYEAIHEFKEQKGSIILPLTFPQPLDIKDPYIARQVPLSELKHWELAPANPGILTQNGLSICLTSSGQKDAAAFWKNLRLAIKSGLSEKDALNALTIEPAKMLRMDSLVGTLDKGKKACFNIYSSNPFNGSAEIIESWVFGKNYKHQYSDNKSIVGKYKIQLDNLSIPLIIEEKNGALSGKVVNIIEKKDGKKGNVMDTTFTAVFIDLKGDNITIQFQSTIPSLNGNLSLHGKVKGNYGLMEGDGMLPDGKWVYWGAIREDKPEKSSMVENPSKDTSVEQIWYPNGAFGLPEEEKIKPETIAFKGVTVWTNGPDGIITDATVIVVDGKISAVGKGSYAVPFDAKIVNIPGLHLTSGIIDEHSHIAISKGVNEGGQSISAEVSIADVIDPDDISIYRQLAGGVTAAQLLHGSANPIGGQSALIKLKWGTNPDEMLIDNAPKFIKCALGENVKQSNWGDFNTVRFPQTRMGVEQVFYDGFNRAKLYQKEWDDYNKKGNGSSEPRRDLELDVLLEILDGQRFITCHSYVQSEINMLMHVADSMGFKINTFTHILEGYKLADKMIQHGVGASTFSDWWAYKFEVNDAIPYNASLMSEQGLVVAINSDDAEMGRRLNQEAAKGVKYGGMSEEDAWKMVTLNPAKLLHLDHRMGSVEVGKDADLVLWTENPLSIEAKVKMTLIDGAICYDSEKDSQLQIRNSNEKSRLIAKMLSAIEDGTPPTTFIKKKTKHFHCNTIGEEGTSDENTH